MAHGNLRSVLGLHDDEFAQTCGVIGFDTVCNTFDNILKLDTAGGLGDDYGIERIPASNHVALLNLFTVALVKRGAVRYILSEEDNACVDVDETNLSQTTYYHLGGCTSLIEDVDGAELLKLKLRIVLGFDGSVSSCVVSHTTGVEGTKCKLCTRLTDRLCCDNTYGFTLLHHAGSGKVAAVALHANAVTAFASEH